MSKKTKAPRGVYQRESGMWYSRIAGPDGKLIRRPLSADLATATIMLNEMRKTFELQRVGIMPVTNIVEFKTFEELRRHYLKHAAARGLSDDTILSFDRAYKSLVLQNRFVYLQDMTLAKVEDWAHHKAGEGLSGQTINYYAGYIKRALQWAHSNGHVRHNVLANWSAVRNTEPRFRRDFLPEEIEKFFAAEDEPEWRLRWLVYFNTGLRLSAGLNVCWEWINWNEKEIRLPLEHNKSRRVHEIPMSALLHDALVARRNKLGGDPVGPIFSHINRVRVRERLLVLCQKAGIDIRGICVHSIRHTVATMIYNNTNGNLKAVQEVLGHTNAATTMRYLHVTKDDKRRAVDSLGFGGLDN